MLAGGQVARGGNSERVGAAWAAGHSAEASTCRTDGKTVWASRHVIGETTPDGRKIAWCCHQVAPTSSSIGQWANEVRECEYTGGYWQHGRPDLHTDRAPHWQRRVPLLPCSDSFLTPADALNAHPDAACVFQCLFCTAWHPNFSWTSEPRESGSDHHAYQKETRKHRVNPDSPPPDALYQRKGFANAAEYHALTRFSDSIYGDDMQGYGRYMDWRTLDQTKDGLISAFPQVLEPQPNHRLWWVVKYGKSQWHRAWGSNPQVQNGAFPALCGLPPDGPNDWHYWGRQGVEKPTAKARICVECDTLAAVAELSPERQADIERVLQESEARFRIQQAEYDAMKQRVE